MQIKRFRFLFLTLFLMCALTLPVFAGNDSNFGQNYHTYMYDYLGNPTSAPPPYAYERGVDGAMVSDKAFQNLEDVKYDGVDRLYFADSGNARIVVATTDFKPVAVISSYMQDGQQQSFDNPCDIEIHGTNLYIADSSAGKIIQLSTETFETLAVFDRPTISALGENYVYQPTDISVDDGGFLYVIGRDINQGLILLDEKGEFSSFLGAPEVALKWNEILVRKLLPKRLWSQLGRNVPTEYNSVFINDKGFLYVTSQSSDISPIAKLNTQGENVLKYADESPSGDGIYLDEKGAKVSSRFVDIVAADNGMYFALDSAKGRVFGYDNDGNLLYIFGHAGFQQDSLYAPTSIELVNGKILITDKIKNTCMVFSQTEFGHNIDMAMTYHKNGEYDQEKVTWQQVAMQNSNYDMATIYLARADIREGDYATALENLSGVQEKKYYALAFKHYRSEWIQDNAIWLWLTVAVLVGGLITVKCMQKKAFVQKIKATSLYNEMTYGRYVIFHPFNGFWDLKREKRGSMRTATILLVLFSFWVVVRARFTGYLFMKEDAQSVNTLFELLKILLPLLLWVVSNWCFTTLMDGEGSMKDIYTASCYALTPYVLLSPILFLASHVLTGEEMAFYTYADTVVWIWVLVLLVIGMAMAHDYSALKAIVVTFLTVLGIAIILFVALLAGNLVQEIYEYFYNIYEEIAFRFY